MQCRYCLCDENENTMINPCACEGSLKYVHEQCLAIWVRRNKNSLNNGVYKKNASTLINSIQCEICKYSIKFYIINKNNKLITLLNTFKSTIFNYKNLPSIVMNILGFLFLINKCQIILKGIYNSDSKFYFHTNTESLMKYGNEVAILCIIAWYVYDVYKCFEKAYYERANAVLKFIPCTM